MHTTDNANIICRQTMYKQTHKGTPIYTLRKLCQHRQNLYSADTQNEYNKATAKTMHTDERQCKQTQDSTNQENNDNADRHEERQCTQKWNKVKANEGEWL